MSETENNNEDTNSQSSIDTLTLRSDEVQEIMSHPPSWMVRWGITLIFVLLMLFLFLSWLIKYPDIISGTATLTTSKPPIRLVVKSTGEIDKIYIKDNTNIKAGQSIALVRNTLSSEAHNFLVHEIAIVRKKWDTAKIEEYIPQPTTYVFGELQTNYSSLIASLKKYATLINENNTAFNIQNTSKQIENQKALYKLTLKQLSNVEKLVENAENKITADKVLFKKGVISQSDLFEREKAYNSSISEFQSIEKTKIQIAITLTDLDKQLNDLKFAFEQKRKTILLEIETQLSAIENSLLNWTRAYQLIAPINGKLSYLQTISKNKYIESGKELFAIIPSNQSYIAQLKIPKSGYGKVKTGQKVMLKIDNFPAHEYGQLIGKVKSVSLIANEENYLVKVELTKGLKTTYNKELNYTPEMSGTAEIITEDLRITDRIFNQFRKIFDN